MLLQLQVTTVEQFTVDNSFMLKKLPEYDVDIDDASLPNYDEAISLSVTAYKNQTALRQSPAYYLPLATHEIISERNSKV